MHRQSEMPFHPVELRTGSDLRVMSKSDTSAAVDPCDPRDRIEDHLPEMRAFALVLAKKRALADHVVTRTVVGAWANIDAFDPASDMRAWLFRLLRNTYYAEHASPSEDAESDTVVDLLKVRTEQLRSAETARFRRAFDALPDIHREAMVLVGPMGFSVEEAATITGCTTTAIRNRTMIGRLKLAAVVSLGDEATG